MLDDIEQVENQIEEPIVEFDYGEATNTILTDKFGENSQSDEAIEFMNSTEFDELIQEKQKAADSSAKVDESDDNKNDKTEEVFDLKNLDQEDYDLSGLKAVEIKAAINAQNKSIRENYELKTQETIKELEITKTKTAETSKENGEMIAAISALPQFLKEQYDIDVSKDTDMQKQLQSFVLAKAAEKAGLTVPEYIAKGQKEEADKVAVTSTIKENVDKAYKDFSEDEDFKALDVENKEELLKKHLIDNKFDPEKGDIKKVARILFMDEYDSLLEEKAIAKALANNSKGSNGKTNLKGKHKTVGYDPNKDAEFIKSMKESGFDV